MAPADHRSRGFSLVELLVVVGIISILVAVSFAYLSSAMESARRTKCLGNLRQIGISMQNYAGDNNQCYPPDWNGQNTWDNILIQDGYVTPDTFSCPDDTVVRPPGAVKRSYAMNGYIGDMWNNAASVQSVIMKIPKPIILVADRGMLPICFINSPSGVNCFTNNDCIANHVTGASYVFTDLHAAWLTSTGDYSDANEATWASYWYTQPLN